jgi:hypothetical protein
MKPWLSRLLDPCGWVADRLISYWESRTAKRIRSRIRHRRAVYRATLRRLHRRPRLQAALAVLVALVCRIEAVLARLPATLVRATRVVDLQVRRVGASAPVRRCRSALRALVTAQRDAWAWLWRMLTWPFRRTVRTGDAAQEATPTAPTVSDGVVSLLSCAACGHETAGTNVRKYARFRCSVCKIPLMVIDRDKGITMVVRHENRVHSVAKIEKDETEESEPVRL